MRTVPEATSKRDRSLPNFLPAQVSSKGDARPGEEVRLRKGREHAWTSRPHFMDEDTEAQMPQATCGQMQAWSPALGALGSEPHTSPDFVSLMGACVEHRVWHTERAQLMSEQRGAWLSKAWPPLCSDVGVSVGQWLLHRSNLWLPHDDLQQDRGPQGGVVKGSGLEPGRPEPDSRPCPLLMSPWASSLTGLSPPVIPG